MTDYYDAYPNMTPDDEAAALLDEQLERVRWPIEDDGYELALEEAIDARAQAPA